LKQVQGQYRYQNQNQNQNQNQDRSRLLLSLALPSLFFLPSIISAEFGPAANAALPPSARLPFKIVIDPGHGGADEGAVYREGRRRITEKEITLALAKQVTQQLAAKGYRVQLTRHEDREVSLADRTAFANQLGADVFISIHMNSSHKHTYSNAQSRTVSDAQGIETFILNHTTNETSKRLARFENSVVTAEHRKNPTQSDIALILKDLRLDATLKESKLLACHVQSSLVKATSPSPQTLARRNRGVKQALFYVLLGADMPAILVEAGFLNHPRDRALVLSHNGRLKMSQAIVRAIENFRTLKLSKVKYPPGRQIAARPCKVL